MYLIIAFHLCIISVSHETDADVVFFNTYYYE